MTRSEQWSLYAAATLTSFGVSAVFALLAELRDRYELPTWSLGTISASAFVAALIVQLTIARYADRGYGTRLLVGGVLLAVAGLWWMAAGTELWQFIGARCLLGFGSGIFLPAARRAVIVANPDRRAERLGTLYGVYLFGFVLGPPVASLLASIGDVRLPFLVLGFPVLAVAPIVARVPVPADLTDVARRRPVVRTLVRSQPVVAAILVVVTFRFSIGVFEPLWAVYLSDAGASDGRHRRVARGVRPPADRRRPDRRPVRRRQRAALGVTGLGVGDRAVHGGLRPHGVDRGAVDPRDDRTDCSKRSRVRGVRRRSPTPRPTPTPARRRASARPPVRRRPPSPRSPRHRCTTRPVGARPGSPPPS